MSTLEMNPVDETIAPVTSADIGISTIEPGAYAAAAVALENATPVLVDEAPERNVALEPIEELTDFDLAIALCTTSGELPAVTNKNAVDLSPLAQRFPPRGNQKQRPALLVPQNRLASNFLRDVFSSEKNDDHVDTDGVHHINISSTGETALGRFLDINSKAAFSHPDLGDFQSLGGLWHFVKSVSHNPIFRGKWGKDCREYGKKEKQSDIPGFKVIIADATFIKILSNPKFVEEIILSTLPFKNYYIAQPIGMRKNAAEAIWYVRAVEEIRRTLKMRIETNNEELQPNFEFLMDRPVTNK